MTSSANCLALALAVAGAAAPATDLPAAPFAAEVAGRVAERWQVPAGSIVLEWGRLSDDCGHPSTELLRLVGRGQAGWFVAVVQPPAGPAVAVRVRAGMEIDRWVAAQALAPGDRVSAGDVVREKTLHWGAPEGDADFTPVGWEVRRPLARGRELRSPYVAPPVLVHSGEDVRLQWTRGNVRVSVTGKATTSARAGESVTARIDGRAQSVHGTAVGPALAEIQGGDQ